MDGLAEIATVARLGVRGPSKATRSPLFLSDGLRCSVPATALVQCPALISLLRHQWTSQGWDDPLEAPDLDPWRGRMEEDCSEAFDDVGFQAWYFDQA